MTDLASQETELEAEEQVKTPVKTNFTPATPPTTARATRAATKKVEALPLGEEAVEVEEVKKKGGKRSPFDGWARRKAGASATSDVKGRKRQGEALEKGDKSDGGVPVNGGGNKKAKGAAAGS